MPKLDKCEVGSVSREHELVVSRAGEAYDAQARSLKRRGEEFTSTERRSKWRRRKARRSRIRVEKKNRTNYCAIFRPVVAGNASERLFLATAIGLRPGPALLPNSLCPGQEEHTMRETEVQIRNSGSDDTYKGKLRTKQATLISGEHRLR
jgi:hypothetical protein